MGYELLDNHYLHRAKVVLNKPGAQNLLHLHLTLTFLIKYSTSATNADAFLRFRCIMDVNKKHFMINNSKRLESIHKYKIAKSDNHKSPLRQIYRMDVKIQFHVFHSINSYNIYFRFKFYQLENQNKH